MTLIQLNYFCTVCRYHSITRAADELHISQPTISVAIKDLEKEFGLQFFNHGKNRISLTEEGESFYKKAEELLDKSERLYRDFSRRSRSNKPLRVGIPPLLSTVFFPDITDGFEKLHDIPIVLFEHPSIKACELVDKGSLDIAIANLDFFGLDKFNYHVMTEETYVFALSKKHRLAGAKEITIDMLNNEKIILYHSDSVQNKTIHALFRSCDIVPNVVMHTSQLLTIQNYLKKGDIGAFIYSSVSLPDKFIKTLPVSPVITNRIGLVWKKNSHINSRTEAFIKYISGNYLSL
ncbi:MAG: LysR family transcriptional regulator [Lachnospiraceae bacterium]|nr:LysR family transcriptional regulator [Lachnospiraceae bacterium]